MTSITCPGYHRQGIQVTGTHRDPVFQAVPLRVEYCPDCFLHLKTHTVFYNDTSPLGMYWPDTARVQSSVQPVILPQHSPVYSHWPGAVTKQRTTWLSVSSRPGPSTSFFFSGLRCPCIEEPLICPSVAPKAKPRRLKKKNFHRFKNNLGYIVSSGSV